MPSKSIGERTSKAYSLLNGKSGGSINRKSSANTGFGKSGMPVAAYKPQPFNHRSDAVATPHNYSGVDIRGVSGFPSAQTQYMYTGKPSNPGKTMQQYGTGLIKEESGDKGKGFTNQYAVAVTGEKQTAPMIGRPGGGG